MELFIPHQLLAYGPSGEVVGTLDYVVDRGQFYNPDCDCPSCSTPPQHGQGLLLATFAEHEARGGKLRMFWQSIPDQAIGSGTWPEFLGHAAHDFRVELEGKRIARLVHHRSKYTRHRDKVESAVGRAIKSAVKDDQGRPIVDLRHLIGGPNRPVDVDENGRTRPKG